MLGIVIRICLLFATAQLGEHSFKTALVIGLVRCYLSRVENSHTVPAIATLEKLARALQVPMYELFYDGEEPPAMADLSNQRSAEGTAWGGSGKDARFLRKLRRLLGRMEVGDRKLLLFMVQKMAQPKAGRSTAAA